MTIENEPAKIDCIDTIAFGLTRTRDWRKRMAAKYPGDPRNLRAVECLSKPAAEALTLTDPDWQQLKPHAGWASETFRSAITEAARAVGFQKKLTDLRSYIQQLLHVLTQNQSIAA